MTGTAAASWVVSVVVGMTATLGIVAMVVALAALTVGGGLSVAGRPGALVVTRVGAAGAAGAVAALAWALATGDFRLAYVAAVTDRSTSWPYRLAGLWGGMGGSLLLWSAMVAAWSWRRRLRPVERAAIAWLASSFLLLDLWLTTPWHRLAAPALDGLGATPILRHPAMLYHPPVLYLGLTGLVVPWAATLAGVDPARIRRQLLATLGVLTLGMVAGAHWAYVELGWGGFWAWDPVENTALLPWLAVVGALHGLRARRRSGPVLVVTALAVAVLGTMLTRSGAAPSVHAFGEDGAVGWALVAVVVAVVVASTIALPRPDWQLSQQLAAEPARKRWLGCQLTPWLAGFALVVVLLGTVRPLIGSQDVAVDGSYYAQLLAPVGVVAVVLALRSRPGQLAHVAVLVLAIGLAGSTRAQSASATLAVDDQLRVAGWTVVNEGAEVIGDDTVRATVTLWHDGERVATLEPRIVTHPDRGIELAETSLRSTPRTDVQVVLRDADDDGRALLEVHVRPLVWFVWWGGLLLAASVLLAAARSYWTAATAAPQSDTSSLRSASASAP